MPATMNARTTDGPARSAMAAAVRTKRPAPMIAPIPSATSEIGPNVRLSVPSPVAPASAISLSMDLVLNSALATHPPIPVIVGSKVGALYVTEQTDHLGRIVPQQIR